MRAIQKPFADRVQSWLTAFCLFDYKVNIFYDEELTGCAAQADTDATYLRTNIRYNSQLDEMTPEELDDVACHEVCHILTAEIAAFVSDAIDMMPEPVQEVMRQRWFHVWEQSTERISRIMQAAGAEIVRSSSEDQAGPVVPSHLREKTFLAKCMAKPSNEAPTTVASPLWFNADEVIAGMKERREAAAEDYIRNDPAFQEQVVEALKRMGPGPGNNWQWGSR